MNFLDDKLNDYLVYHSQDEPDLLKNLNRETWQKALAPRMLSGHYQGRVLALISKLKEPKTILEIGTYTGYSALCLAEGIQKSGILHTIDHNEELMEIQKKYFDLSDYKNVIKQHLGNALDIVSKLNEKFDLVFIDADKENYINYFNVIINKMNKGGIILSDNVLWSGKVVEVADPNDKDTLALQQYNSLMKNDPRIESVVLPIRDGLTISRVR